MSIQIIPVIHYASHAQAMRNAERAFDAGCAGVMLIHMNGLDGWLIPAAQAIKKRWPDKIVGTNLLSLDAVAAVRTNLEAGLDATWTDEQLTHSEGAPWESAEEVQRLKARAPQHLVFAGVAFKHQRHEPAPELAAIMAIGCGFIPTTSGPATGVAAASDDVAALRVAIGHGRPLAIASGITPANARAFAPHVSHLLVATGVSSDFHEFDPALLAALVSACPPAAPAPAPAWADCPFDARLARTPYLVLPKLAIQVMPMAWRVRFHAMLSEMEAEGIETPSYHVFRDDGRGERYTRATVVNEQTGFIRLVKGEDDPWADYRHNQQEKVAALCPGFRLGESMP